MASRLLTQGGAAVLGIVVGATVVVITAWWNPGGESSAVEPQEPTDTSPDEGAGKSQVEAVPGQFTDEQISAMSADEAREAIKTVALARVQARNSGDSQLEARLRHEFNLLMDRMRTEPQPEGGSSDRR